MLRKEGSLQPPAAERVRVQEGKVVLQGREEVVLQGGEEMPQEGEEVLRGGEVPYCFGTGVPD